MGHQGSVCCITRADSPSKYKHFITALSIKIDFWCTNVTRRLPNKLVVTCNYSSYSATVSISVEKGSLHGICVGLLIISWILLEAANKQTPRGQVRLSSNLVPYQDLNSQGLTLTFVEPVHINLSELHKYFGKLRKTYYLSFLRPYDSTTLMTFLTLEQYMSLRLCAFVSLKKVFIFILIYSFR